LDIFILAFLYILSALSLDRGFVPCFPASHFFKSSILGTLWKKVGRKIDNIISRNEWISSLHCMEMSHYSQNLSWIWVALLLLYLQFSKENFPVVTTVVLVLEWDLKCQSGLCFCYFSNSSFSSFWALVVQRRFCSLQDLSFSGRLFLLIIIIVRYVLLYFVQQTGDSIINRNTLTHRS
jgi:hypothetical protein